MKKKLLFVFIALLLTACGGNQITDSSRAIEVNAGKEFTIVIASNPTTGYHWEIIGELENVELVSKEYRADEPIVTGSGGVDVWTFQAVSSGETQITLGYYPPSNELESPEQTVTFVVIVK